MLLLGTVAPGRFCRAAAERPNVVFVLIDDGSLELYDLQNDLGETRNLAAEKPDVAADLVRQLRAWRKRVGAAMPTEP
jgi:hypothetical protein